MTSIYTRTGDDGTTGLVGGERISKSSTKVIAYGEIDELNSWIGYAISLMEKPEFAEISQILSSIQHELFDVGCELASPHGRELNKLPHIQQLHIDMLEKYIDQFQSKLPQLKSFILPGGNQITSSLHIARTVARRAERSIVALNKIESVRPAVFRYINRLSDLLFSMARYCSLVLKTEDVLWKQTR